MITFERLQRQEVENVRLKRNRLRVAYIMSRFPKLTETFVLNEMLAMKQKVGAVEIYPLMKENAAVVHTDAAMLVEEAHYTPFVSAPILRANLEALRQQPVIYRQTFQTLIRETQGNRHFLMASLALFPKAVYLAKLFKARRIDHIHAHFATHPAAAAFIIHRLADIPFSFTAHGSDLHRHQEMLCAKVEEAAFVTTISEYNRRFILDHCGEAVAPRLHVIHCGVDVDRFQAKSPLETLHVAQANGHGTFQILAIGTLHEVKGQRYLIDAIAVLRDQGIYVACELVGDGPDRDALERQVRQRGVADRVTFFGHRSRDQVIEHLKHADLLVAPSVPSSDGRREGIPVVLIEAMASGVPVVASRLSGIPELVQHEKTGLLAEPADVDGLAAAIRRLFTDRSLAQHLSCEARRYIEVEFNLHKNTNALAQLFTEVRQ